MITFCKKLIKLLAFIPFYFADLVYASLRISWDIITIKNLSRPGIVAVPLDTQSELEITVLANLITFSPGTLVVDLSQDRRIMYIHTMFLDDTDTFIRYIKENFERRILEILR